MPNTAEQPRILTPFEQVLSKYRDTSVSERHKGYRFERLMQAFLKTLPEYSSLFTSVWLWNEFPSRADFGSGDKDVGIDLVARTKYGDYWAVQCKCYQEDAHIDKPKVDTFLSSSGKSFYDTEEAGKKVHFSCRLWLDTTIKGFTHEAEATIHHQTPEVKRLGFYQLDASPVDWLKLDEGLSGKKASVKKFDPLPHQMEAINEVHERLKTSDRGKLIMACGTGKTFTSLRIAENETTQNGGLVLFLVPSIALLGQTLREWKTQCVKPIHPICICSDSSVSKKTSEDDTNQASVTDLALPASTDSNTIKRHFQNAQNSQQTEGGNIVVFSTYQSINVISEVQKLINKQKKDSFRFDLVICDEAHRTTGVTLSGIDESAFVKVHDNTFIGAKKRLYMTATPRLYSETAQQKAREAFAEVCSMDDPALYGEEMYRIGFGKAVDKNLLSDYKVIVLTIEENQLSESLQKAIKDKDEEINAEDSLKIIGCINALSKKSLTDKELFELADPPLMRSAVAFCQNIAVSKLTKEAFNVCGEAYFSALTEQQKVETVIVEADHVDGTMGAQTREQKLHWLKSADPSKRECKILNNVRCLSEGVDVPSLDAVMFLSARNSQIDVVQSVGRVMRKAEGKKYGYIIIPVVVLPDADTGKVLSSDRFKVVWTVLNALRAHDDRFDATVNKIELNKSIPDKILVLKPQIGGEDEVGTGGIGYEGVGNGGIRSDLEKQLELEFAKLQGQIYAKIVQKCGSKPYWEQWAADVAQIAEKHIESITAIVKKKGAAKDEFEKYINGLRKNINPSVTEQDAIEMLAQHIITQPVFEALFEDYSFVKNNTVSKSLQGIIEALNEQTKKADAKKLERLYVSVQERASGLDNGEAKQKIIVELYDKFFRTAFPKVTEKLGIVYTPVEIVDFIIHSVEDVLQKEFSRSMSDENVHILDPFTGTGTFITRLLQSGIIKNEDLERKYKKEIHANEIILLAYYIASINIENVYHDMVGIGDRGSGNREDGVRRQSGLPSQYDYEQIYKNDYYLEVAEREPEYGGKENGDREVSKQSELAIRADNKQQPYSPLPNPHSPPYTPFPGICLTDTFQLGETAEGENLFSEIFPQNSQRVLEQQKTPLRVIFGNPPYSIGQRSANDNAQNQGYPKLENRIAATYARGSSAVLLRGLYDSYIKAFRWASDRIDSINGGVIAFISNSGWIDKGGFDSMRKSLEKEFSAVYILNLKGAIKGKSGEAAKREGQNVFDIMTGVAITLLIKNPSVSRKKAVINYYNVGDYLSRKEKFKILTGHKSFLNNDMKKQLLTPNEQGDWINKRNSKFEDFIPLILEKKFDEKTHSFFNTNAIGAATNRDTWTYNFSENKLKENMKKMIGFYNEQNKAFAKAKEKNSYLKVEDFIDTNPAKISWTRSLRNDANKNIVHKFKEKIVLSIHRPFTKLYLYYDKPFIESPGIWLQLFPSQDHQNIIICVSGLNTRLDNTSVFISNVITDLNMLDSGTQCFPLYWYEKKEKVQGNLFEKAEDKYIRHDAISDFILEQAKTRYGHRVTKEDIFYYVYGLLHSPDYRKTFANDLKKMLPRLPLVEKVNDFWSFSKAGRELADLHLNYEDQPPPKEVLVKGVGNGESEVRKQSKLATRSDNKQRPHSPLPNPYSLLQMKFPSKTQKDTIIYNSHITVSNIPAKAYEYIVNGKSAIEWVMERYAVTTHKESGIKNDPNDWAAEHEDPQYILDLLLSVITVSVKTVDIVAGLPKVEWE